MDRQRLHARYAQLDWTQQLGNLASTLARIASRAGEPQHDDLVDTLLREAAAFIEWSAPCVPAGLLIDLAAMQRELLAWRRVWPDDQVRPILALYARNASDRLLYRTGLIGQRDARIQTPSLPLGYFRPRTYCRGLLVFARRRFPSLKSHLVPCHFSRLGGFVLRSFAQSIFS